MHGGMRTHAQQYRFSRVHANVMTGRLDGVSQSGVSVVVLLGEGGTARAEPDAGSLLDSASVPETGKSGTPDSRAG